MSTIPPRLLLLALIALISSAAAAEDGYDLWLRYRPAPISKMAEHLEGADPYTDDDRVSIAAQEFNRAVTAIHRGPISSLELQRDYIALGTPSDLKRVGLNVDTSGLGDEGYLVRTVGGRGHRIIVSGNTGAGILYGTFALIREIQAGHNLGHLNLRSSPRYPLRILDHWDNLDGTVERGYAGPSLWNWAELPKIDPRLIDYARANASVGINGTVVNSPNADARILTPDYLRKVAAIADAFRPYGIRVYVSARFSAPKEIGGLATADPLDHAVRAWWRAKAAEIYRLIPDFGGFLVKANSEGQPGPQAYGRTHADGANMLGEALAPHHGIVMWRAFVYSSTKEDRAKQAYDEFRPLDGKFLANVIVQVKNGPVDFQPREPFHPLFGQMMQTSLAMEVQITREYLGQRTGIAFLAPMWSEALGADTCSPRCGTPVRDIIKVFAGVANMGTDRNWTGNHFDQANWYAFGRLAWNPALAPSIIAAEWTRMTWGNDRRLVRPIVLMMLSSREAAVDAMTPLGLAHQMATDHHYGPGPWICDLSEPSWNPCYYSHADIHGIGFDRTAEGSNAVAQYSLTVGNCFAHLRCVSDAVLLWFHHVPWTYQMRSGRSLWDELVVHYDLGVARANANLHEWHLLRPFVDGPRHAAVAAALDRQSTEFKWWRDASIAYWQGLSKLPLSNGHAQPPHRLSWYEAIHFDTVPGYLAPGAGREPSCVPPEGGPPCGL